ncbi:hypothetical protein SUGI_0992810 [Cryptomeria japonica]|uniref:protein IQ-DOMAIN 2-like n=1 Tax=Cryptomeria japonica TaxID=3369 RepID=UPI0024148922|nr:protein IQ-DOMAIN 2-like [Cryptomeria japonica]XP_057818634.2 protein IQ-DOMAIN 2-like [Cryptomeria japonica]XP_057818635.2 protein IQ-DOMAIN 2-like [Cryptomeria japonica]XP_057818636.2 protein IQ-DOMAIN 2-like [Cryptomeria japonica]XP_057818637.2 protein IQ-DOMAIN 2-like [Cryptomeria japonica]XP_057818638.2 protein IQ-DOMAIN 2-like [Cryptomeria japonica]XP_057818639.2 protein IQ-DOMAIN 2-like [Cryptomeria japonica]XP_057818640.2 protein IQ-DOMAIN 2-like [Cryptomeria japonica]XP_05906908
MGKSSKIIKSLILGAKAFSKDRSGVKKEQFCTQSKIKNQLDVDKAFSCGYDPDDDTEDGQDSKSNEHTDQGIPESGLLPVVVNAALHSETTVAKPTHEDSEIGLSDTVVRPDNFKELAEEQDSISRTKEEFSIEENAAIVIQAAFRGFLGRRAFRAIKASLRFQDLAEGQIVKQQKIMDSRSMQALIKVQAHVRARQVQMSEEGQAVQQHIQQKRQLHIYGAKSQEDWDHSLATLDELQAKLQNKQDAAIRREKALAYASLQQLRICGQRKNQQVVGPDCVHPDQHHHLGWTWLERWMATRPSDNTELEKDIKKNHHNNYLDDNKPDTLTAPQYGKIKRNKKKTIDKQTILSPNRPIPYNNPITMKSPSPSPAKSSHSRTLSKPSGTSGQESSVHNTVDKETGSSHLKDPSKLLLNGDENNKDHVNDAEESCGSNVICSSPEIKAKADGSIKISSHDPKLRHKSSTQNGPTKLRNPNYMSTTQSSKAKVHHSSDPTKLNQQSMTSKSTPALVSLQF